MIKNSLLILIVLFLEGYKGYSQTSTMNFREYFDLLSFQKDKKNAAATLELYTNFIINPLDTSGKWRRLSFFHNLIPYIRTGALDQRNIRKLEPLILNSIDNQKIRTVPLLDLFQANFYTGGGKLNLITLSSLPINFSIPDTSTRSIRERCIFLDWDTDFMLGTLSDSINIKLNEKTTKLISTGLSLNAMVTSPDDRLRGFFRINWRPINLLLNNSFKIGYGSEFSADQATVDSLGYIYNDANAFNRKAVYFYQFDFEYRTGEINSQNKVFLRATLFGQNVNLLKGGGNGFFQIFIGFNREL